MDVNFGVFDVLSESLGLSVDSVFDIIFLVVLLLLVRGPTTIRWTVVPVVVDSIES